MSVGYDRIALQTTKGNKMLEIGQTFTTLNSGVTGIIKAIDNHPSGVNRILLDVNGAERWTSAPALLNR
jgi:hypothetical protein